MRSELDPFKAGNPEGAPDIVLAARDGTEHGPREIQGPAHDGTTTALEQTGELLVLARASACTVPAPPRPSATPVRVGLDPGFPMRAAWAPVLRPAMQLALHGAGAAAVHAAAVEDAGRATLVAGWSESGKTEVALALVEAGASFLSDKWTVVGDDGEASAFPVSVGVRGWVLPALPRLRAALPVPARAQLAAAGAYGLDELRLTHGRQRRFGIALVDERDDDPRDDGADREAGRRVAGNRAEAGARAWAVFTG